MPPSRREDLIDAAERVFRREGFRSPSVDRVIQEAGVSRMTLYNHFKGKDDLAVAAVRRSSERAIERLAEHLGRAGTLGLFDLLRDAVDDAAFQGCLFQRAADEIDDVCAPARRVVTRHRRAMVALIAETLANEGFPAEVLGELAEDLLTVYDGALVRAQIEGGCPEHDEAPADAAGRARLLAERLLSAAGSPIDR
ncbi:MAG: TetR/AcrR family transcriptional regulator [Planctomycetota bacterium]